MNNPLIEMAEHEDKAAAASNKYARIPMAERMAERHRKRHERQARILRAAAAVILQMQCLRADIQERRIFWPAEVDVAIDALDSYEAACKEGPK